MIQTRRCAFLSYEGTPSSTRSEVQIWVSRCQSSLSRPFAELQSHGICCDVSQVKRLVERDRCSLQLAQSKVAAQMPLEIKQKKSQYVIDNSSTRQKTEEQVRCNTGTRAHTEKHRRDLECMHYALAEVQCSTPISY